MSQGISIENVWTLSRCGTRLNERSGKLADKSLRDFSISQHQEVPISLQQATSIHRNRPKGDLVFLEELPDNIPVPSRRAEVLLYQIVGDCFVNYGVSYGPKDPNCDPICKLCRGSGKETVEHIIIRCTGRQFSRRKYLGRVSRETPYQLCKTKLNQVLQFLNNEGLLERSSAEEEIKEIIFSCALVVAAVYRVEKIGLFWKRCRRQLAKSRQKSLPREARNNEGQQSARM